MFSFWFLRGKLARGCQKMYPFAHARRLTALLIFARIMFMNCSRFYSAISGGLFEISKYLIIITEERRRRCSIWRIFEGVFQRGEHINNYLIPPLVHRCTRIVKLFKICIRGKVNYWWNMLYSIFFLGIQAGSLVQILLILSRQIRKRRCKSFWSLACLWIKVSKQR